MIEKKCYNVGSLCKFIMNTMFKKSVCIDSVHQCNDDVQNDRIFRGNHQHSRMLLQVRIDMAYSFTVLFIIYKFLKLADKSVYHLLQQRWYMCTGHRYNGVRLLSRRKFVNSHLELCRFRRTLE